MALLDWSDELVLGEATMDATHREFVECLNAVADADDAGFIPALDRFIEHSDAHFTDENERMEATNFPPAHCHLNEHTQVLNLCREVRQMVIDGKLEVGRVLANELAPWFTQHAQSMDNMLAYWLNLDEPGREQALAQAAERQAAMQAQMAAQGVTEAPSMCGAGCEHDHEAQDEHAGHVHAAQPVDARA
jgi:hemerythrin